MRILFVNPRTQTNLVQGNTPPTAVLALASFMRREGHQVRIYERNIDKKSVSRTLDEFNPDVIACTLMFAMQIADMQAVCARVRALRPGLPILCGGVMASIIPELLLMEGLADYVGIAEGEHTLLELLEVVRGQREPSAVQSLVYLDQTGQPVRTPLRPFADLSDFPETDFTLLPMEKYFGFNPESPRTLTVFASKGCPGQCTFCINASYHRCQYRARKRETVLREIETLVSRHGAGGINFIDETWGVDKEDLRAYCDGIAALSEKLGRRIGWACETRIGVLDPGDLERMARAGCRRVCFGLESGSPEILARMRKGYPIKRIETDINNCKAAGIGVMPFFIFGFPGETPAQARQTVHTIFRLNPDFLFGIGLYYASPGTADYNALVSSGRLSPPRDLAGWAKLGERISLGENHSAVPDRELKVIRGFFYWRVLFQGRGNRKTGRLAYAKTGLRRVADMIGRKGSFQFFLGHFRLALGIVWYSCAYPGIRKKYDLHARSFGRKDWDDLSHLDASMLH